MSVARKILLVEDEPAIADLLVDLLEDEGYDVALAANGYEAWPLLIATRPDIVLSDVMMPVVDGHQLCGEINRDPRFGSTPVVLMSASAENHRRCGCVCAGFVSKPFALDQVVATLALALSASAAAGA